MHVWKLAVLRIALPGWSYADCYGGGKKTQHQNRRREKAGSWGEEGWGGCGGELGKEKKERNETVLYPRLDTMMMGTLRI